MKNKFCIYICALTLFLFLCSCSNNQNGEATKSFDSPDYTEMERITTIQSENETEENIDFSKPVEFVDYRKFIGQDVSVLNTDTSRWDDNDFSHDLWNGSFYGHNGTISVRLGWDDKTIIEFFLALNDSDKIKADERDMLHKKVMAVFGNNIEERNISYTFSGIGDFEFCVPKTLEQESVCTISWNSDIMYNYMCSKPKEPQEEETTEKTPKKEEPRIGMTAEDVRKSTWGEPKNINKTTYTWGTKEQWCYSGYRYIYFENGIVTAIQERK